MKEVRHEERSDELGTKGNEDRRAGGVFLEEYFYGAAGNTIINSVIILTGFALVGGPASEDHAKAVRN